MGYSEFHSPEAVAALLREAADEMERENDMAERRAKLEHMIALGDSHADHLNRWRAWQAEQETPRWEEA
jgi:hypothetical protein